MLPLGIAQRKKTGFVVPVKSWFRNELKDTARDILLSSSAKKRGYFNIKAIGEMLDSHINGKFDFGQEIWTLLVFELWQRRFWMRKFKILTVICSLIMCIFLAEVATRAYYFNKLTTNQLILSRDPI